MSRQEFTAFQIAEDLNRGRARTKTKSQGYMALCPNHADKNPSLSIRQTESGRILLKCFATTCTDTRQVYDSVERYLNLEAGALGGPGEGYKPFIPRDLIKNERPAFEVIMPVPDDAPPIWKKAKTRKLGKPTKIWAYNNEQGRPMGYVARYDIPATDDKPAEKLIWPWCFGIREGKREWLVGAMPEPRIPYNLDKIIANPDAPILWHEGEKSADAGTVLLPNWISTTTVGGGSAPHMTDFRYFKGRTVIICPDNDAAGVVYAAQVAMMLLEVGAKPMILRFPTNYMVEDGALVKRPYIMREGDDMADHLERGWTTELLREALAKSSLPLSWPIADWSHSEIPSD